MTKQPLAPIPCNRARGLYDQVMEDEPEAELRNPFPSPPSNYKHYTAHNIDLLSLLRERTEGQDASESSQHEILSDQTDVPEWPLTSLEKPRVDWIREEGHYSVFGDTWFVRRFPQSLHLSMMIRALDQRNHSHPWRGWGSSAILRGCRRRYVIICLLFKSNHSLPSQTDVPHF
jgi:MED7 protein